MPQRRSVGAELSVALYHSVTMIVPFSAGGGYEMIGRVVAEWMKQSLGQPSRFKDVSGAEGTIAVCRAARAAPNGYTLILGGMSALVLTGASYSLPYPYDPLNDFAPNSPLGTGPLAPFARQTMPATDMKELIAWLKVNPTQASAGISAASIHVLTDLLAGRIDYQWRHLIENCLQRLKEFRRIATRYDKTDQSFAAAVHLAASYLALR
jgi:tripartite-type tricarboxylate transporter receptor subunit TctC